MADPILEFDPASESSGSPLTITTGNYGLTAFSAPAPPPRYQWASSVDTEGARLASIGHENRTISISLEVSGDQAVYDLQQKLSKLHREGGTLKYTTPAAIVVTFDVLAQEGFDPAFDHLHYLGSVTALSFSLPCKPYGRGAEVDLGDNVNTTLPYLEIVETSIPGDVPALGRLLFDNDGAHQWWLTWGLQSRYYSSSANAALFYQAEGRTPLSGAATAVGSTGASGGGSNVVSHTSLTTTYQAILSTQATGGGAHLSHVGTFQTYMRVWVAATNIGTVSLQLEWAEGDYLRPVTNTAQTIPTERSGRWLLVPMGLVTLRPVTAGTQRWEGRILAKSTTAGDDVELDYLLLIPVDEGSGVASGVDRSFTPTVLSGIDQFTSTTAGVALNARVAPTGGTWATSGDATDFLFSDDINPGVTSETAERDVNSGTNGRFGILGSTNYTNVVVEAAIVAPSMPTTPDQIDMGVIARWTDSSNHLRANLTLVPSPSTSYIEVRRVVAGSATIIATAYIDSSVVLHGRRWRLRLTAYAGGRVVIELFDTDGEIVASNSGYASAAATGGTLATGKPGLFDRKTGTASTVSRYYDDFYVSVPPEDGAVFASQSLELRHDRIVREDSTGTLWNTLSSYEGDYLLVPCSGAEARTTRMIIKTTRAPLATGDIATDDDNSAKLFVTPRYLVLPDPTP